MKAWEAEANRELEIHLLYWQEQMDEWQSQEPEMELDRVANVERLAKERK